MLSKSGSQKLAQGFYFKSGKQKNKTWEIFLVCGNILSSCAIQYQLCVTNINQRFARIIEFIQQTLGLSQVLMHWT